MGLRLFSKRNPPGAPPPVPVEKVPAGGKKSAKNKRPLPPALEEFVASKVEALDGDPLRRLMQQERFGVILAEQEKWTTHAQGEDLIDQALLTLESRLALVPTGWTAISKTLGEGSNDNAAEAEVKPFYMAVHPVTNAQFQKFVDGDGYEQLDLWPEDILPHLIEFQDLTNQPGPRYWREGRHNALKAEHPVVGISWYEANAYAKWVGLRLPTEAEWQMLASWRIRSAAGIFRRFPWGDAMDSTRCNVWSSGLHATVPVKEYPRGAAPNGVLQLIGNVWEWMADNFEMTDEQGREVLAEMPMKGVRGGAFDTYFETQTAAEFRSGLITLSRNHNTGFRCAIGCAEASWLDE